MGKHQASHRDLLAYLDYYYNVFTPGEAADPGLEICYRHGHGYCSERTAWVHYQLALDTDRLEHPGAAKLHTAA
jgi:hypothetical protein